MKPLLSLVMIVKDEAETIKKTLWSCLPAIDHYTILDTGSTDDTKGKICGISSVTAVKGHLCDGVFVDYSQARNAALDLAVETPFCLMLSGSEYLNDPKALRAFCLKHIDDTDGAYDVEVKLGANRYPSPRLTRTASKWRYKGVTHEMLVSPNAGEYPTKRVPGAWILHDKNDSDEKKRKRCHHDAELLEAEWKKEQTPRTAFYLGQTYECLGEIAEALKWYSLRVKMGGWREEVYEAMFRSAKITLSVVPHIGVVEMLDVYNYAPHRAEPLYELGLYYYRIELFPIALLFAQKAASLPYPKEDRLFVIDSYYHWQAWDLVACCAKDDKELALRAARAALLGDPENKRLLQNVDNLLGSQ